MTQMCQPGLSQCHKDWIPEGARVVAPYFSTSSRMLGKVEHACLAVGVEDVTCMWQGLFLEPFLTLLDMGLNPSRHS